MSYNLYNKMYRKEDSMEFVNFTEARNNLKSLFDRVCQNSEEVIINRKNGENVVVISLDEFNALKETHYLLSSPETGNDCSNP